MHNTRLVEATKQGSRQAERKAAAVRSGGATVYSFPAPSSPPTSINCGSEVLVPSGWGADELDGSRLGGIGCSSVPRFGLGFDFSGLVPGGIKKPPRSCNSEVDPRRKPFPLAGTAGAGKVVVVGDTDW